MKDMMKALPLLLLPLASSASAQVVERAEWTSSSALFQGVRLVGAGDVDGDGVADLAVLDPFGGFRGVSSGRVSVVSGATRETLYEVVPTAAMEWFQDLAVIGDVDGDGAAELVIGLTGDGAGNPSVPGRARVVSGAGGAVLFDVVGDQASDAFGVTVAGVGDMNGDGVPDLAVGAEADDVPLSSTPGSVRICSGLDGTELDTFYGPTSIGRFGSAIAGLGDVDGDGIGDLAVGASGTSDLGLFSHGAVYGVSGADGSILWTLRGETAQEFLGWHVTLLGDLDGDGAGDVGVGSPLFDGSGTDRGRVLALSGADGTVLWSMTGDTDQEFLGGPLAAIGDVSGDDVPDLSVGSVLAADPGAQPGTVRLLSGADGAELVRLANLDPDRFPGVALAGLGDWNGDGTPDLAVATSAAPGVLAEGSVQLYLAGCSSFDVSSCTSLPNSTGQVGSVRAQGCGTSLDNGAVELVAEGLPVDEPGFFMMSDQSASTPIGGGVLCLGGPVLRLADEDGIIAPTGPTGQVRRVFDLASLPAAFQVTAGSTWLFQFIHRDSAQASAAGPQLTSSIGVTF